MVTGTVMLNLLSTITLRQREAGEYLIEYRFVSFVCLDGSPQIK